MRICGVFCRSCYEPKKSDKSSAVGHGRIKLCDNVRFSPPACQRIDLPQLGYTQRCLLFLVSARVPYGACLRDIRPVARGFFC